VNHNHYMLQARDFAVHSNCLRRRIGVVFRYPGFMFTGANAPTVKCRACNRAKGDCPAIHAEVKTLLLAGSFATRPNTALYIWAEIPCVACLSFIAEYTEHNCNYIHCLTQASYAKEYPNVLAYTESIAVRHAYALKLGITIYEHDAQELLRPVETKHEQLH